jgi:hypothetical protein
LAGAAKISEIREIRGRKERYEERRSEEVFGAGDGGGVEPGAGVCGVYAGEGGVSGEEL